MSQYLKRLTWYAFPSMCLPPHPSPASMLLQAIPSGTAHRPHLTSPPNPTVCTVMPFTWVWYNLYTLLQTYTFSNCTKLRWNCYTVYQCTTEYIYCNSMACFAECVHDWPHQLISGACMPYRCNCATHNNITRVHTHTHRAHTVKCSWLHVVSTSCCYTHTIACSSTSCYLANTAG